jgi:hypothetical protein
MKKSPIMLIDRIIFKEIIRITYSILRNNFFYSEEVLKKFSTIFIEEFASALIEFDDITEMKVKKTLYSCRLARFEFTCLFSGDVIRDILINDFYFSHKELKAFNNIISKHGDRPIQYQSKQPRTLY